MHCQQSANTSESRVDSVACFGAAMENLAVGDVVSAVSEYQINF